LPGASGSGVQARPIGLLPTTTKFIELDAVWLPSARSPHLVEAFLSPTCTGDRAAAERQRGLAGLASAHW
jgi:hypothetical protein